MPINTQSDVFSIERNMICMFSLKNILRGLYWFFYQVS